MMYQRAIKTYIRKALENYPIVYLFGVKGSGKSTLANELVKGKQFSIACNYRGSAICTYSV